MPKFTFNNNTYNVADEYIDAFIAEYPEATTELSRDGQTYSVRAKYYNDFIGNIPAQSTPPLPEGIGEVSRSDGGVNNTTPEAIIENARLAMAHPISRVNPALRTQSTKPIGDVQASQNIGNKAALTFKDVEPMPETSAVLQRNNDALSPLPPLSASQDPIQQAAANDLANRAYNQEITRDTLNSVAGMRDEAKKKIKERAEELRNSGEDFDYSQWQQSPSQYGYAPMTTPGVKAPNLHSDREMNLYRLTIDALDEAQQHMETALKNQSRNGFQQFGAGVGDALFDLDTLTLGLSELSRNATLLDILNKVDRDEQLTEADEALLNATLYKQFTESALPNSRWYSVGQMLGENVPYMIEFALSRGAANAITGGASMAILKHMANVARKASSKTASKFATKAINKTYRGLGRMVENTIASSIAVPLKPSLYNNFVSRQIGTPDYTYDQDGNLQYNGRIGALSPGEAFKKAYASSFITNMTESLLGEGLSYIFNKIGGISGKGISKGADIISSKSTKAASAIDATRRFGNRVSEAVQKYGLNSLAQSVGYNGAPAEFVEEMLEGVANALVVGDQSLNPEDANYVFDKDGMIDTAIVTGITALFMGGAASAASAKVHHDVNKAYALAERNILDFGRDKETGEMDKTLQFKPAEIKALNDIAINTPTATAEWVTSISRTMHNLALQRNQLLGNLSDNALQVLSQEYRSDADMQSLTDEEMLTAAKITAIDNQLNNYTLQRDYVVAAANYNALIKGLKESVQPQYDAQMQVINDHAHAESGLTIEATYNGQKGYLVSGKVKVLDTPQGKAVVKDPDAQIYQVRINTPAGEAIQQVAASDIQISKAVPTQQIIGEASERIFSPVEQLIAQERQAIEAELPQPTPSPSASESEIGGVVEDRGGSITTTPVDTKDVKDSKDTIDSNSSTDQASPILDQATPTTEEQTTSPSASTSEVTTPPLPEGIGEVSRSDGGVNAQSTEEQPLSTDTTQAKLAHINAWLQAIDAPVVIFHDISEVDNPQAVANIQAGNRTPGWFANGTVYIYLPHAIDERDIDETIMHECIAHYGIPRLFATQEQADAFYDEVWNIMPEADKSKYINYPGVTHLRGNEARRAAADEYIAHLAEQIRAKRAGEAEVSLWQRIVSFFRNALRRANVNLRLNDADLNNMLLKSLDALKKNNELPQDTTSDNALNPNEVAVTLPSNGTETRFSIRSFREEGRAKVTNWLDSKVTDKDITRQEAQDILDQLDTIYDICQEYTTQYAPFGDWSEAQVNVDVNGNPVLSVIKSNGEYAMNLDFSLVCKKRRTLDAVFQEMIARDIINDFELDGVQVAKVNEIIRSYGFETACRLCFVDAKRFRIAAVSDTFVELFNELSTMSDRKLRQVINAEPTTVRGKAAQLLLNDPSQRIKVSRSDFMSAEGFERIKRDYPEIMKLYNAKKGTGGPKASFGDVQYLNDIDNTSWTPDKAYAVGGVRLQSFSDYVPRMVFDYVQMIADLAAKRLPVHAYTKEAVFAKQFGLTGIKINLSLVPRVEADGIAPGLDRDGNYVWQEGETFPYDTAIAIQNAPGYRDNCGTIAVGVSDAHILKMLDDENIRMVIPYHKSGLNPAVAIFNNIDAFVDYTNEQNTRYESGSKLSKEDSKNHFNFNEALRKAKGNPRIAAQQYLDWCRDNNYLPKFDKFASHPNYYKLLEDFTTMYTVEGVDTVVPQHAVEMRFPTEQDAFGSMRNLIAEGLEADAILEGQRNEQLSAIVDEIAATLPKKTTTKTTRFRTSSTEKDTTSSLNNNNLNEKVLSAESEVNTNPTEAQKEAGNYKKGHVRIGSFDISIEQPQGSIRRGVDANGKAWESKMYNTYGYIRGTEGVDGDHIDVFLANDMDSWNGEQVFVVDQYNEDGTFDEHKVMLGFNDINDAETAYLSNYEKDWAQKHHIVTSATTTDNFRKWIDSSHRKTKAFADYKNVETTAGQATSDKPISFRSINPGESLTDYARAVVANSQQTTTPTGLNAPVALASANYKNKLPDTPIRFRMTRRTESTVNGWINRRTDLTPDEREAVIQHIDKLDGTTLQLATAKWFAQGTIRIPEDNIQVEQAIKVAARAKVDPLAYDYPQAIISAFPEAAPKQTPINPDDVPTLTNKQELPNDIIVYDVDNSEESMRNMREIINTHLGIDANPWCILQANKDGILTDTAHRLWQTAYKSLPRRVAFRNGRLIAFFATGNSTQPTWWDRQDLPHIGIPFGREAMNDGSGRYIYNFFNEETGEIYHEKPHSGNRQDGIYREWDNNGNLIEESHYSNGRLNGVQKQWDYTRYAQHPDYTETLYVDGQINGYQISKDWLSEKGLYITSFTTIRDGSLHGIVAEFAIRSYSSYVIFNNFVSQEEWEEYLEDHPEETEWFNEAISYNPISLDEDTDPSDDVINNQSDTRFRTVEDTELIDAGIARFQANFHAPEAIRINSLAELRDAYNYMTDEEFNEEFHNYKERTGMYDSDTNNIYIFVENTRNAYTDLAHEATHAAIHALYNSQHLADKLGHFVSEIEKMHSKFAKRLAKAYTGDTYINELASYAVNNYLADASLDRLIDKLSPDAQKEILPILKHIGYEQGKPQYSKDYARIFNTAEDPGTIRERENGYDNVTITPERSSSTTSTLQQIPQEQERIIRFRTATQALANIDEATAQYNEQLDNLRTAITEAITHAPGDSPRTLAEKTRLRTMVENGKLNHRDNLEAFRDLDNKITSAVWYNDKAHKHTAFIEGNYDSMRRLDNLIDDIRKNGVFIDEQFNPWLMQNQAKARAQSLTRYFDSVYRQALYSAITDAMKAIDTTNSNDAKLLYERLSLYAQARTAIERQRIKSEEAEAEAQKNGEDYKEQDFAGLAGIQYAIFGLYNAINDDVTSIKTKYDKLVELAEEQGIPTINEYIDNVEKHIGNHDTDANCIASRLWKATRDISAYQLETSYKAGITSRGGWQTLSYGRNFDAILQEKYEQQKKAIKDHPGSYDNITDYDADGNATGTRKALNDNALIAIAKLDSEYAEAMDAIPMPGNNGNWGKLINEGWLDQADVDGIHRYYEYYMPLKGHAELTAEDVVDYEQKTPRNQSAIKAVQGHTQLAKDPFNQLVLDTHGVIQSAEQNRWRTSLYNLLNTNPNPSQYVVQQRYYRITIDPATGEKQYVPYGGITTINGVEVFIPGTPTAEELAKGYAVAFNNRNTQAHVDIPIKRGQRSEHEVVVFVNGESYTIFFYDKRIADAINGRNIKRPTDITKHLEKLQAINRLYAGLKTSLNPTFTLISNLPRDWMEMVSNNFIAHGAAHALSSFIYRVRATRAGDVQKAIRRYQNGELLRLSDATTDVERYVVEFFNNGGQVNITQLPDYDTAKKELIDDIERFFNTGTAENQNLLPRAGRAFERMAERVELAPRIATYIASRTLGRGITESINDAKEATVNFDRKGAWSGILGMFSLFYNASAQSVRRQVHLARTNPKRFMATYATIAALSPLTSIIASYINSLLLGDDDDLEDICRKYFAINPELRRHYIVILVGDQYIRIPMAVNYAPYVTFGDAVANLLLNPNSREWTLKDTLDIASAILDTFTPTPVAQPIGFSFDYFTAKDETAKADALRAMTYSALNLVPVLEPLTQALGNYNFMGGTLYDTPFDRNSIEPAYMRARNYTQPIWVGTSQLLNNISGGNEVKAGYINLPPEAIENLMGMFGGYGEYGENLASIGYVTADIIANREINKQHAEDFAKSFPMLSRLYGGNIDERYNKSMQSLFYDDMTALAGYNNYRKAVADTDYVQDFLDDYTTDEHRYFADLNTMKTISDRIRKEIKAATPKGENPDYVADPRLQQLFEQADRQYKSLSSGNYQPVDDSYYTYMYIKDAIEKIPIRTADGTYRLIDTKKDSPDRRGKLSKLLYEYSEANAAYRDLPTGYYPGMPLDSHQKQALKYFNKQVDAMSQAYNTIDFSTILTE